MNVVLSEIGCDMKGREKIERTNLRPSNAEGKTLLPWRGLQIFSHSTHVLRELDLATLNPPLDRSPNRITSPHLRLGASSYVAVEEYRMLYAEKREGARDERRCAWTSPRRESSDGARGEEESADRRGRNDGAGALVESAKRRVGGTRLDVSAWTVVFVSLHSTV